MITHSLFYNLHDIGKAGSRWQSETEGKTADISFSDGEIGNKIETVEVVGSV